MNKVLIIVRDFPPYYHSFGGIQRVLHMSDYLISSGFEVFILCARGVKISDFGYSGLMEKLHITSVDDPWQKFYNKQYLNFKENKRSFFKPGHSLIAFLKNIIHECCIPDLGSLFVKRYVQAGQHIIKTHSIRHVIVSSPAHSTQLIGLKLKQLLGSRINLVVDYRDSWNTRGACKKRTRLGKKLSESLERDVLRNADHFIFCSAPMISKISKAIMDVSHKAVLVMNGFDMKLKLRERITLKNEILTFGYFGRINHDYSLSNFFNSVRNIPFKVSIKMFGSISIHDAGKESLKNIVELYPEISHQQALKRMQDMDVLLILYSDLEGADEVVTSKVFDYMLSQKPILVVGPKNMEVCRIVLEEKLGYVADLYDPDNLSSVLHRIYSDWENDSLVTYDLKNLEFYSLQNQFSRLLPLLKDS